MSHNATPPRPAEIATVAPTALTAAGVATVTVTGQHFTPTAEPVIDAALGALVPGSVVVTWPTTTTSEMTFDVVVSAPPGTLTDRTLAITQGGHESPTSTICHGFDPGCLLSNDGMWYDSADPTAGNHVMSGTTLATWKPRAGKSGANADLDCTIASPELFGVGAIGGTKAWITWHAWYRAAQCKTLGDFAIGGPAPGAPWTMAAVSEVVGPGFATVAGVHKWILSGQGGGGGGGGYSGSVSMQGGPSAIQYQRKIAASLSSYDENYVHQRTANNILHDITDVSSGVKRTVIGTWDGTENAGALRLYVNGVDQGVETNTVEATNALSTYLLVDWEYACWDGGGNPLGSDMIVCGDIFVAEKAISAADALSLHDYWADKFNF